MEIKVRRKNLLRRKVSVNENVIFRGRVVGLVHIIID